jgi:gliding motility-associated-like protein
VHRLVVHPTPSVRAGDDLRICAGQSVRLRAAGADSYAWSPQQGLSCTDCPDPLASPDATVDYVVRGSTAQGCRASDTVRVWVIPRMRMAATGSDSICLGDSVRLFATGAVSWEWSPATGLSATDVPSPLARPTLTTRYRVVGRDGHNCFSDTAYLLVAVGQPVRVDLGPDVTLPTGTQLPLRSTITNGPVRTWAWSPSKNLSCTGCALPVATVRQHVTYQVRVTSIYGCQATDSIRITAFCETAQVFIPNAFSPDGDGVNDVLMVRAQGIGSVRHFRIFNRWGEVVFERNNFPPNDPAHAWNGQVRGKPAWPDVFVYTAEVVCDDGTTYTYKGNITLIK